jgi:hypothetical protein
MAINPYGSYKRPGVFITEDTYGKTPAPLADHSTVYCLGFSNKVGAPVAELTFIADKEEFDNAFGSSLSKPAVDLYFAQYPEAGFYFINVKSRATRTVTATVGAVGDTYTLTIDGLPLTHIGVAGDTEATILSALGNLVNTAARHLASFVDGKVRLINSATTVVGSSNLTVGSVSVAPAYPVAQDVIDTADLVLIPDLKQGFIVCPEFYKSFNAVERTLLANSLDGMVARDSHKWVNIVDCGLEVATSLTGAGAINLAKQERATLTSPAGHSSYYFPYWKDSLGVSVPMSMSVAAIAVKKYRSNFAQPPAGTGTPVLGVTGQTFKVTDQVQEQLNPLGINCGRVFDSASASVRRGAVVYGARTLSTSPFWTFTNTRVIANVLEGTLRNSFDNEIFANLDGEGEAFNRISQTGTSICERLRLAGAFYGTATDAYQVVCDERNNPKADLDNARVNLDIYFKPSPIIEVLVIRCHRTGLDTNFAESMSKGNAGTATEGSPTTKPSEGNSSTLA